jgi:plasmid maintenance system antidote protein VapI
MAMTTFTGSIADTIIEPTAAATITRYPSNICVGRRLRARRTSSGISERELCEKLGIDRDDLSAYELGAKRVSANLLLRIAKLLNVRPDYFFQGYTAEELSACLESFPPNIIHSRVPGALEVLR